MWVKYNPNPYGRQVGDCAVRALSKALNIRWETAYNMISRKGLQMGDMPSSDSVWGAVLKNNGFCRFSIANNCPDCYTAKDFCIDHPKGVYVLGFGGHAVAVVDGDIYDSWDSSKEIPQFYWERVREYGI